MHNRRQFLLAAAGSAAALAQPEPRLNVVFVLADDLGWADVGCNGGDLHETPHIDRLAASGMRFTHAYSAAPICSPTRASIMTGKHPARLHMTIWYEGALRAVRDRKLIPPATVADLPHSETTLAEVLRERGYATGLVGKWHLGSAAYYPETQGFDSNVGGTLWGAPNSFFYPYRGTGRFGGEFRYVPGLDGGKEGEYLTDRFTEEAIRFIDRSASRPFFLYLAHHAPHTPIQAKKDLIEHYQKKIGPGMNHQNPVYAAMVHSLDESVGRILRHLEEKRLADRTIVVFTSDNGGYINPFEGKPVTNNHPLRSGKGSLYEGGIRVPLLIRWPGKTKPGSVCGEPVVSTDLFSTLSQTPGGDGKPLTALLDGSAKTLDRDALYFHYPHYYATTTPVSAIRTRDYKLLHYYEDNRDELYDLTRDEGEKTDLAAKMPERAAALRGRLEEWLRGVDAQLPRRNPAIP